MSLLSAHTQGSDILQSLHMAEDVTALHLSPSAFYGVEGDTQRAGARTLLWVCPGENKQLRSLLALCLFPHGSALGRRNITWPWQTSPV